MTCQLQTLLRALQEDLAPGEAPRKQKEVPQTPRFQKQATLPGLPTWETHDWWSLYVNKLSY